MSNKRELLDFAIQHHAAGHCCASEAEDVVSTAKAFGEFVNSESGKPDSTPHPSESSESDTGPPAPA